MNQQQSVSLTAILQQAAQELPHGSRTSLRRLLGTPLMERLAQRLQKLHATDGNETVSDPKFANETTLDSVRAYSYFADAMRLWISIGDRPLNHDQRVAVQNAFAAALETASHAALLRILGQRTTKASIIDYRAFPPDECVLYSAASETLADDVPLCHAAKALDKHAGRSEQDEQNFWPAAAGSDADKNSAATQVVTQLLDNATWWNVFAHGEHGLLYEVRIASGHGARWTANGDRFIGFVDPFETQANAQANANANSQTAAAGNGESAASSQSQAVEDSAAQEDGDTASEPLPPLQADAGERVRLTREQLEQHLQAGRKVFQQVDFSGTDLSRLDLSGLDFSGSDFRRCKLFRTSLQRANLTETDLTGTFLSGTELTGAVMRRASLRHCRADNVVWSQLDTEGARMDGINLRGATIEYSKMRRTGLAGADLTGAILDHCRLYGAFLEGCTLNGAYVHECRLNNARMATAEFEEARFDRSTLDGADMSGSDGSRACFHRCNFVETVMTSINLQDAKLLIAVLDRARLTGARLANCQLPQASLVRADLSRASLNQADLTQARLEQADLSRSDLRKACLNGANLQAADLTGADVVDTTVDQNTLFEAAKTIGVDFGTNWLLRQQVRESTHNLTISHFRRRHPVLGFVWWAMLGCGRRPGRLLGWGIVSVLLFAGIMQAVPASFDFGQPSPHFIDHLRNSLAVFVTLDLAVDKGVDSFGRSVMLAEMLLSYLMLGFMASLFSGIFPNAPE